MNFLIGKISFSINFTGLVEKTRPVFFYFNSQNLIYVMKFEDKLIEFICDCLMNFEDCMDLKTEDLERNLVYTGFSYSPEKHECKFECKLTTPKKEIIYYPEEDAELYELLKIGKFPGNTIEMKGTIYYNNTFNSLYAKKFTGKVNGVDVSDIYRTDLSLIYNRIIDDFDISELLPKEYIEYLKASKAL